MSTACCCTRNPNPDVACAKWAGAPDGRDQQSGHTSLKPLARLSSAFELFSPACTMETLSTSTSLLVLNDYCLDNIFQYFGLEELMLLFGKVHTLIDNAVERQLYRFHHLEFSMRFPPQYNVSQLQALGRHLQTLSINVGYSVRAANVLAVLQPLCMGAAEGERLRALRIQHVNVTIDYVNVFILVAPHLHELDLSRCDVDEPDQLMLVLRAATQLKTLALYNKDMAAVEQSVLSRMQLLKINWLVSTELFDVATFSQSYPSLSIIVYQSNQVDVYGPPVVGKLGYFH